MFLFFDSNDDPVAIARCAAQDRTRARGRDVLETGAVEAVRCSDFSTKGLDGHEGG